MDKKKMVKTKILECKELTKQYHGVRILDKISFSLSDGEVVSIIGPSGCGKTTFLKCVNLLEIPDSGQLFLADQEYFRDGEPLYALNEIRESIGFVFQDLNLFPNMSCKRNIALAAEKVLKLQKDEIEEKIRIIAKKLSISEIILKYPDSISGGEAQRVCVARALILKPRVLLLDEITSALDPVATVSVMQAILELRRLEGRNMSIIFVTHNLNFALKFSDRILYLKNGSFIEEHPSNEFVNKTINDEVKNYIDAAIRFK